MRSCVSRKDRSSSSTSSSNAAMPSRVERSATEREQAAVARRVGGEDDRAPAGAANGQTDAAAQWPPAELESTPLLAAVEHRAQPQPRGRVVVRAPAHAAAGGGGADRRGNRIPADLDRRKPALATVPDAVDCGEANGIRARRTAPGRPEERAAPGLQERRPERPAHAKRHPCRLGEPEADDGTVAEAVGGDGVRRRAPAARAQLRRLAPVVAEAGGPLPPPALVRPSAELPQQLDDVAVVRERGLPAYSRSESAAWSCAFSSAASQKPR